MIKQFKIVFYTILVFLIVSCNKKEGSKEQKETILEGTTTVLVDETLTPIVEDQVQIFESKYNAKVNIDSKSEGEVVQSLINNSSQVAILARTLTKKELSFFDSKKLIPKITPFAKDAIALIANKSNKDTLIALNDVVDFLKNQNKSKIKGLVFDNPNSSTARYICELAGIKNLPENNVFSFKTNSEVIKYIAKNDGMIGVVGINYLYEPSLAMKEYILKINVLNLKNTTDNQFYGPTQNNIAEGKYPLARDLYLVNCQGFSGLGMGFASFIAGDIGQRIILKSGLVPVRFPSRKIIVRKEINNDKK